MGRTVWYLFTPHEYHKNQANVAKYIPYMDPMGNIGNFNYNNNNIHSWWLNHPSEKYARPIGSSPQIGMKIKIFETTTQYIMDFN